MSYKNNFQGIHSQFGMVARANTSHRFTLYKELDYGVRSGSLLTGTAMDISISRWIMKLRGELLSLNFRPYNSEGSEECSLCNLRSREDTIHFVCVCPVLKEFRVSVFGLGILPREAFVNLLNGGDWPGLVRYAKMAWRFRSEMVAEFNF